MTTETTEVAEATVAEQAAAAIRNHQFFCVPVPDLVTANAVRDAAAAGSLYGVVLSPSNRSPALFPDAATAAGLKAALDQLNSGEQLFFIYPGGRETQPYFVPISEEYDSWRANADAQIRRHEVELRNLDRMRCQTRQAIATIRASVNRPSQLKKDILRAVRAWPEVLWADFGPCLVPVRDEPALAPGQFAIIFCPTVFPCSRSGLQMTTPVMYVVDRNGQARTGMRAPIYHPHAGGGGGLCLGNAAQSYSDLFNAGNLVDMAYVLRCHKLSRLSRGLLIRGWAEEAWRVLQQDMPCPHHAGISRVWEQVWDYSKVQRSRSGVVTTVESVFGRPIAEVVREGNYYGSASSVRARSTPPGLSRPTTSCSVCFGEASYCNCGQAYVCSECNEVSDACSCERPRLSDFPLPEVIPPGHLPPTDEQRTELIQRLCVCGFRPLDCQCCRGRCPNCGCLPNNCGCYTGITSLQRAEARTAQWLERGEVTASLIAQHRLWVSSCEAAGHSPDQTSMFDRRPEGVVYPGDAAAAERLASQAREEVSDGESPSD